MANTSGEFIVLGIEENETGSFKKIGFSNGDQDEIYLKMGGMQFFRID
jgi:hypothetical protein